MTATRRRTRCSTRSHAARCLLHLPRRVSAASSRSRMRIRCASGKVALQRLSCSARHDGAEAAGARDDERHVLRVPRREARPDAVGTPAGRRGLLDLPRAARLEQPRHAQGARPAALPVVPLAAGPPEPRVRAFRPARRRRSAGHRARARQLHELSLASAWLEPSLGFVADTVTAMEQRSHETLARGRRRSCSPRAAARRPRKRRRRTPRAWACKKCTFAKGYDGLEAEIGARLGSMTSSAKFGDYTGLDEDGVYVVANADGGVALESGYHVDYELARPRPRFARGRDRGRQAGRLRVRVVLRSRSRTASPDTGETIFGGLGDPTSRCRRLGDAPAARQA